MVIEYIGYLIRNEVANRMEITYDEQVMSKLYGKDGSVTISLRNFVGEGIIKQTNKQISFYIHVSILYIDQYGNVRVRTIDRISIENALKNI
jgi:hypothetical protein